MTSSAPPLEAVIPAAEYREKPPADSHLGYDDLLARAADVVAYAREHGTPCA
jgi:hypothetical protein